MFKLILYNIGKHKILYILIGVIVALLSFYLVIGMNVVFSISQSLKQAVAQNMSSDVIIASPRATTIDLINKNGEKKTLPLEQWEELLDFVRSQQYVACAAPRLRVWGTAISDQNRMPLILTGIDPAAEWDLLPRRRLDSGTPVTASNQIALYYRHADILSASLDDNIGLRVTTVDGYRNFDVARLCATLDYQDIDYYSEYAVYGFVTIDYLNTLLQTTTPLVTEIFVRLDRPSDARRLQKDIRTRFGTPYTYVYPQNSSQLVHGIYQLSHVIIYFISGILFLMVFLCSSFIVSLSVETRRAEIGIYQAIGVHKWKIGLLMSGEFLIVMLFFALAGAGAALLLMHGVSTTGIKATIIPLHLVFGRSLIFIKNTPQTFIIVFGALVLSFMANVLSAIIKISKLDPVEILREI